MPTEYCTASDVQNRLTAVGYKFVADRDRSGTVSSDELASYITTAIEWAGVQIDRYIMEFVQPDVARGSSNPYLKYLAVDLAAYRACGIGGRGIPDSITEAHDAAMDKLREIEDDNGKIPAFLAGYPTRGPQRSTRRPRAVNPR